VWAVCTSSVHWRDHSIQYSVHYFTRTKPLNPNLNHSIRTQLMSRMSCHSFVPFLSTAYGPSLSFISASFIGRHLHDHSPLTPLPTATIGGLFEQVPGHPKRPDFINATTSGFTYDSLASPDHFQYLHTKAFGMPSLALLSPSCECPL